MGLTQRLATLVPDSWLTELRRHRYRRQILSGRFVSPEPELAILPELVHAGDWVVDIGANVGHYTMRLSELVGPSGRVIAFEPVPATFALLAANVQLLEHSNVTLLNAAVSDKATEVGIVIPRSTGGLKNYYQSHLSTANETDLRVLTITIDKLGLDHPIALVKIDAEGHESFVLQGMQALLRRDRPSLIVETGGEGVARQMAAMGYLVERLAGSPNLLFRSQNLPVLAVDNASTGPVLGSS